MHTASRLLPLAALVTATACGAGAPAPDLEAEAARLEALDAEWSRLASEGTDVEAIVSYWSDDAVLIAPGQPPVVGKAALREMVAATGEIPGWSISWEAEGEPRFSADGTMAWMRGTNRVTYQDADGETVVERGQGMTVWRKDAAGEWKCVADIWNAAPPEAPPAG